MKSHVFFIEADALLIIDVVVWCQANLTALPKTDRISDISRFEFDNEDDALFFKLRWSGVFADLPDLAGVVNGRFTPNEMRFFLGMEPP